MEMKTCLKIIVLVKEKDLKKKNTMKKMMKTIMKLFIINTLLKKKFSNLLTSMMWKA